ncbi:MAG: SMC-Scp complex subunit ScpB [Desulfobacteraceae bacterium]|nr:SMC-Scp complex subunit ScpB [Desulfobacteraceae bacterium]MBC2718560.1 SMC-Scp complex subunit ScpB [Desulfobacteraceae bacterium]
MEDIKNIIESLLFVAEDPLTIDSIKKVLDSTASDAIRNVLNKLSIEYEARKGGFFLREVAGGYQIRTRPEYSPWIRRLLRPNPLCLSNAALETLAIVAYKQPVIRSDIEHLRGVDCGGILRMLLERKLIRVVGRKEIPGRPMIYTTTKKFLELFELKDLKDLPSPKEIEELGDSSSESFPPTAPEIIEQTGDENTKNS